jgi:hypothetical protein
MQFIKIDTDKTINDMATEPEPKETQNESRAEHRLFSQIIKLKKINFQHTANHKLPIQRKAAYLISEETIERARRINLAEYLISRNEPLTRSGLRYRHRDHDSLVFTENTYYWNSRQEYGNTVDYLTRHMGMTFREAIEALTREPYLTADESSVSASAPGEFNLEINTDQKRAIAYLNKTRGIDYSIIKELLRTKHLFQESGTNNILFPIYDELNMCVGAEVTGTLSEHRYKGLKANSKYGYGFNIRFTPDDDRHFDYALFFESAIDLLSFIDIKTRYENKPMSRCILTSMSGLKLNVIHHTLEVFSAPSDTLKCVLCIDNDNAADNLRKTLTDKRIDFLDVRPAHEFKDFNEQLLALRDKR